MVCQIILKLFKHMFCIRRNNYTTKRCLFCFALGKKVVGEYTLKEPNGNIRTVKYVADKDGFHAEVFNSHDEQDR